MRVAIADMAQVVEHVLGKDEVTSSNLVISSRIVPQYGTHIENPLFKRVFSVFRAKQGMSTDDKHLPDSPVNTDLNRRKALEIELRVNLSVFPLLPFG